VYIFSRDNCLRQNLVWLVKWKWFDNFIILCILLNSITLAVNDNSKYYNTDADQEFNDFIGIFDSAFTYIFIAECVFNIIALGFVFHKNSYLQDPWNILDFFIVVTSVLAIVAGDAISQL
jgi:hypothetical protein